MESLNIILNATLNQIETSSKSSEKDGSLDSSENATIPSNSQPEEPTSNQCNIQNLKYFYILLHINI